MLEPISLVLKTNSCLIKLKDIPSSCLIVLAFQSAGLMAHGGFFQTTYADKIKNHFGKYLKSIGEEKRAESLRKLPVDMALLSLAVQMDKKNMRGQHDFKTY